MIENFLSGNVADTRDFFKVKFEMFQYYLDLYGSEVVVRRLNRVKSKDPLPNYDQLIDQVYRKVASKDIHKSGDKDYTEFTTKLILHGLEPRRLYANSPDPIVTYLTEKTLELGDEIQYKFRGKIFPLQVTDINQYDDILYEFTLQSVREYVETK